MGAPIFVETTALNMNQHPTPDDLRRRMMARRRKHRFVRISFSINVIFLVVIFTMLAFFRDGAPAVRVVAALPSETGEHWMVEQRVGPQGPTSDGDFRILHDSGDEIRFGDWFQGAIYSAVEEPEYIAVSTGQHLLRFKKSADSDWTLASTKPLAVGSGDPYSVLFRIHDVTWVMWGRGREVVIRPVDQIECEPITLTKNDHEGYFKPSVVGDRVLTAVMEHESGDLTLLDFKPSYDKDANRAIVQDLRRRDLKRTARRFSYVALGDADKPTEIFALVPKTEENTREWDFYRVNNDKLEPIDAPDGVNPSGAMASDTFVSMSVSEGKPLAVYAGGGQVHSRTLTFDDDDVKWSEAKEIEMDAPQTGELYIAGVIAVMVLLVMMGGQGVWLVMNREREIDRTIHELLKETETDDAKAKKRKEPALPYAGIIGRSIALLLDLAMTAPLVMVLQEVYKFEWADAWGFMEFGSIETIQARLPSVIEASLVTLGVLSLYAVICETIWGRTFGKALMRLRVVNADGEQPDGWRIGLRNLMRVFELLHWTLIIIPMSAMLLSGKQQRLGDLLAGTFVVVDVVPDEMPDDMDI